MTYNRVCNKSYTTGATRGARTTCTSKALEFIPVFVGFVLQSLLFFCVKCFEYINVCPFVFHLAIVLFVDFFPAFEYSFFLTTCPPRAMRIYHFICCNQTNVLSYKPITNTAWVRARLRKLQKGCTRLAAASDKVYQLLAHGRWFSPGTTASSTTKTDRHDIAKILLKVALNTKNQIKFNILIKLIPYYCEWWSKGSAYYLISLTFVVTDL
jgi:hypothetical protein